MGQYQRTSFSSGRSPFQRDRDDGKWGGGECVGVCMGMCGGGLKSTLHYFAVSVTLICTSHRPSYYHSPPSLTHLTPQPTPPPPRVLVTEADAGPYVILLPGVSVSVSETPHEIGNRGSPETTKTN